jgi:hypothetical protein
MLRMHCEKFAVDTNAHYRRVCLSYLQILGHSIDTVCAKSAAYKCEKVALLAPDMPAASVLHLQALHWRVLVRDVPLNVSTIPAGRLHDEIVTSGCCGGNWPLYSLVARTVRYHIFQLVRSKLSKRSCRANFLN